MINDNDEMTFYLFQAYKPNEHVFVANISIKTTIKNKTKQKCVIYI